MGRPVDYEILARYVIRADDKNIDAELEWLEEQIATRDVAHIKVYGLRLSHAADLMLSNSEGWENDEGFS